MQSGEVVGGRFVIERKAGAGGMGTVYRCTDQQSGQLVALKTVDHTSDEALLRFAREQELTAQLRHPGIVRYIAHGTTDSHQAFLAMEWIDGEDLQTRTMQGAISVKDSLLIGARVADALHAAHQLGIVHRDIKPSNIMLVDCNPTQAKVLDFGIAQVANSAQVTRTGSSVGTPGYMAPEQIRGERSLDGRCDLFALGCILFRCISGRAAYLGDNLISIVSSMMSGQTPSLLELVPDVPPALDVLIQQMLATDANDRPRDGAEVAQRLQEILGTMDTSETPTVGRVANAWMGPEQRMRISVEIKRGARELQNDTIKVPTDVTGLVEQIHQLCESFHSTVESLSDMMVARVKPSGMPTEQAQTAARLALRLRELLPDAELSLVSQMDGSGRQTVADLDYTPPPLRRGIWVDDATSGLLELGFDLERRSEGVRLIREKRVDTVRTLLGKPTSCVGRERELDMLRSTFVGSIDDGSANVVLVTAGPGVGKSRLRHEFMQRIDALDVPYELFLGRADSVSAGTTFGMLAGALRRSAGILEGEDGASARAKLLQRVGQHVPAAEAQGTAEFLGEMIGVHFDASTSVQLNAARQDAMLMSDRMLHAWEAFLAAEAKAKPVLLVLEDLHWGDLSTVKYVDAALRHLKDASFMVLALARPEVHQRFVGLWSERNLNEVRLGGLSKKSAEKLIKEVLGKDVSDERVQTLIDRADGNAFYLEELVRTVAEGKGETLPDSVLGMVQARLAAIEGDGRKILKAASVFGETAWSGGIATLIGASVSKESIEEWLKELTTRELLSKRATSVYPGESEYVFRHALVRDAAYALVGVEDRRTVHKLAGEWLEKVGSNDPGVLAEHFDRGAASDRALPHYVRAAEQALEGNDLRNAIARAAAALRCGAAGETLGVLKLIQTDAHRWLGEFADAERRATEATEVVEKGSVHWLRAVTEIVTAASRQGFYERVEKWVHEASDLEVSGVARLQQIQALASAASGLLNAGRFDVAHKTVERVLHLAGDLQVLEPRTAAQVWRMRGSAARHLGDFETDLTCYRSACEAFTRAGDLRNASNAQVSYGFAYLEIAQFDASENQLREALQVADSLGLQTVVTRAYHNLAMVRCAKQDFASAETMEKRAIEASHKQGDSRLEAWSHVYLSTIYYRAGDFEASLRSARACAEMPDVAPAARAGGLAAWARAALALDDLRTAVDVADKAMALLKQLVELEEFEPLIRLVYAEAKHRSGDTNSARQEIEAARKRVMERANFIHRDEWRQSFLNALPDNARTIELANAWGKPS